MHRLMSAIYWSLGIRRGRTTINGFNIAYIEKGRGFPLILLHGLGANKDSFLPVIPRLSKRYRVIVPDLPGFGESDRPETAGYLVEDQIERVRQFAHSLDIERFSLGGNSMGGLIAGAYAATHPEHISSLLLLAPAGVKAAKLSPLMERIEAGEDAPILARNVEEFEELLKFTMYSPPKLPGFVKRAMANDQADRYQHHNKVIETMFADRGLDEILDDRGCNVPTLIIWGKQDQALDVSGAQIIGKLITPSELLLLDQTGHVPQMEHPALVANKFLEFNDAHALP